MKAKDFISNYLSAMILVLALVFALLSIFMPSSSYDTEGMASHVSKSLDERFSKLDRFTIALASQPAREAEWPVLKNFSEDMVIYRYAADTLHSWYNLLAAQPTLENLSEYPSYHNYGRKWYLVKLSTFENEKFVQALLVKDDDKVSVENGNDGVNRYVHLHGKYDIVTMDTDDASVVRVQNTPVFSIAISKGQSHESPLTSLGLRWTAVLLLVLSAFVYLRFHPTAVNCLLTVLLLVMVSFVVQGWGGKMAEYSQIFSPTLYAHDGLLDSFGTLLIFNSAFFLSFFSMFMCRRQLALWFSRSRRGAILYAALLLSLLAFSLFYFFYTLQSLVMNSGITLELYRISLVNLYTFGTYISYSFLSVGILLLCDTALAMYNQWRGTDFTLLRLRPIFFYSTLAAFAMLFTLTLLGFKKEENRVAGWSNRLAVDRNLGVEMALKEMDVQIASDPVIDVLSHSEHSEQMILRRLEELMGPLAIQCSISASVVAKLDSGLRLYMESLVVDGVAVGPGSHFIYNRNSSKGSYYTGVFSYYSQEKGLSNLIVEVTPRFTNNVQLPPTYSYAKYEMGRLTSFSGNFAYPTVFDGFMDDQKEGRKSFVQKGVRHFVTRINAEEVIVVSRREERLMIYIITFSYMVFLLMLLCSIFRRRSVRHEFSANRFSRRMLSLVIVSLTVTLVAMAAISVMFVYQRNERNMANTLSNRINSVQVMLDGACRQVSGPESLLTPEFHRVLDDVSRTNSSMVNIYSPQGLLLVSNSRAEFSRREAVSSLIEPEAYRSIILDHQRYYIQKAKMGRWRYYKLYAPVMNASGNIVAIASTMYYQRDYDFRRDAVFHAATVISVFLILLFITILIASSTVKAIFRPLVAMGEKMQTADAQNLEHIEYKGDDEISSLVVAYNTMVSDLQESTGKLAAAERDKAWSEMARQVAHEIKNPLTPIKLEIQRLQRLKQRNAPGWEEKFDTISAVILEHIDILTQTANEFSTFAKLYSEPSVQMDLDKVLKEQLLLFENRGVQITYLGAENALLMGPKPQLIRVFVNLLTNAIQAVENVENPRIMVSLRRGAADNTWDVVVEDNGPGVSEENRDRLFTPNFTTKSSGTGLGLAICRSICDRCGGSISYSRSFTLGGACFTVTLPQC